MDEIKFSPKVKYIILADFRNPDMKFLHDLCSDLLTVAASHVTVEDEDDIYAVRGNAAMYQQPLSLVAEDIQTL